MNGFRLTERAEVDLDEIAAYTKENWGLRQAEIYASEIDAVFHRLAADPRLGQSRSDLRDGLLSWPAGRHLVFFRRDDGDVVTILRILHQSQDFVRHF